MNHFTLDDLRADIKGKSCVVIGSAPSCLENNGKHVDSYDIVIRVNNYKTKGEHWKTKKKYDFTSQVGSRIDYHYSFYGGSIRKTDEELKGIKAHLCKCPDALVHPTAWHKERNYVGCDFTQIYRRRRGFWIAPVYIPTVEHYYKLFNRLKQHVPSTGLACINDVLQCHPSELYITGFDFMKTPRHNVNELWLAGDPTDPIGHDWEAEQKLFTEWVNKNKNIVLDNRLKDIL